MYMIIGGLSLALTTVVVWTDVVFMEFMWIEHRDFEGGPLAYLTANSSIWWQTFGTAANQVTNFLGDGLLVKQTSSTAQHRLMCIPSFIDASLSGKEIGGLFFSQY